MGYVVRPLAPGDDAALLRRLVVEGLREQAHFLADKISRAWFSRVIVVLCLLGGAYAGHAKLGMTVAMALLFFYRHAVFALMHGVFTLLTRSDMSRLHAYYADPRRGFWVAQDTDSGELVGCIAIDPSSQLECELKRLSVSRAARRAGLATQLVQAAEAGAWQRGYDRIWLRMNSMQLPAMRLYDRLGYSVFRRRRGATGEELIRWDKYRAGVTPDPERFPSGRK